MIEPMDFSTPEGIEHIRATRCLEATPDQMHRCYLMRLHHEERHECTCGITWGKLFHVFPGHPIPKHPDLEAKEETS